MIDHLPCSVSNLVVGGSFMKGSSLFGVLIILLIPVSSSTILLECLDERLCEPGTATLASNQTTTCVNGTDTYCRRANCTHGPLFWTTTMHDAPDKWPLNPRTHTLCGVTWWDIVIPTTTPTIPSECLPLAILTIVAHQDGLELAAKAEAETVVVTCCHGLATTADMERARIALLAAFDQRPWCPADPNVVQGEYERQVIGVIVCVVLVVFMATLLCTVFTITCFRMLRAGCVPNSYKFPAIASLRNKPAILQYCRGPPCRILDCFHIEEEEEEHMVRA